MNRAFGAGTQNAWILKNLKAANEGSRLIAEVFRLV